MTDADQTAFALTVRRLARGRARDLATDHIDGLFSLLDDVPWDRLEPALEHSAKHDRFFPDVPSIRKALELVSAKHSTPWPTRSALKDGDRYCEVCDDTGWEPCTIDASHVYGPGATARAVRVCACRPTNPIYRAKRDAERPISTGRGEA